jgi:hypothetical protein
MYATLLINERMNEREREEKKSTKTNPKLELP